MTRTLYFHNNYHYGDCLFSLHFLIKIAACNDDISCAFYCKPEQRSQLQEFIPASSRVFLSTQKQENSYDLWGGVCLAKLEAKDRENYRKIQDCDRNIGYANVCKSYFEMNRVLCDDLGVKCPFNTLQDTLFDEDVFVQNTYNQSFDYLLVNSYCLSGQVKYSQQQQDAVFLDIIDKIRQKGKTFITTHKLQGFPCTQDANLSLVQIGQLARNCKTLIGVPTAPFVIALNTYALKNYDKIINITHDECTFELGDNCFTLSSYEIPIAARTWARVI